MTISDIGWALMALSTFAFPFAFALGYRGSHPRARFCAVQLVGSLVGVALMGTTTDALTLVGVFSIVSATVGFLFVEYQLRGRLQSVAVDEQAALQRYRVGVMDREVTVKSLSRAHRGEYVICELSFQSYTTDRRGGSGIGDWTYLVRPDFSVQPWKSWFEFRLPKGDVPRELQAVLDGIAAAAAGEELEFEAFRNEVTAYWIPPGERIDSTQVFGWLEQLARF